MTTVANVAAKPIREEHFYELATREVAGNRPSVAVWGKAFSQAGGDVERARALYIALRVEHLGQVYQRTPPEILHELRAEIEGQKPFLCPFCGILAPTGRKDRLFTGAKRHRYYCGSCGVELWASDSPHQPVSVQIPGFKRANNGLAVTGFIFGLASMLLYAIGIIPILAVVFSVAGLATFKPDSKKNKWMAVVGLMLGAVYTVVMLNPYWHMY